MKFFTVVMCLALLEAVLSAPISTIHGKVEPTSKATLLEEELSSEAGRSLDVSIEDEGEYLYWVYEVSSSGKVAVHLNVTNKSETFATSTEMIIVITAVFVGIAVLVIVCGCKENDERCSYGRTFLKLYGIEN